MAKRRGTKSGSTSSSTTESQEKAKVWRFRWWWLILGCVVVPLAVAFIPKLAEIIQPEPPRFGLVKPITRPDSGITIEALNSAASRKLPLNVEFDGLLFMKAGQPIKNDDAQRWHFVLNNLILPDSLLRDGAHRLRLSHSGGQLSDYLTVIFHTKAPVVEAEVIQKPGEPTQRTLAGRVASTLQAPAETLAVDIVFHHEGSPRQITVPVKRISDESLGLTYFEFEAKIQGLPKLSPENPRYSEPFFAFRVTDQAGNQYYHQESYAQFMAPGNKRFGVNTLADVEVQRLPPDVRRQTRVSFRVVPKPQPIKHLLNGEPPIILRVTSITQNVNRLEWSDLPAYIRANEPLTVIFRDEQQVAISFENKYSDENAPKYRETKYRVEQEGSDGQVYSSNTATPLGGGPLRSSPRSNLSQNEVKQMLKTRGFFDNNFNKPGIGIRHNYSVVNRQDVNLVFDKSTGLTWQQNGSQLSKNESYIKQLNEEKYGGYNDWRLPTIEEAMSLMATERENSLYIDPVFDKAQKWILTSDSDAGGIKWVVNFSTGRCHYGIGANYYVRAVRR